MASSRESIRAVSRFMVALAGRSGRARLSVGFLLRLAGRLSGDSRESGADGANEADEADGANESTGANEFTGANESTGADGASGVDFWRLSLSLVSTVALSSWGVTAAAGTVWEPPLKSEDGVQAHIKMKASTKANEPVFFFTAANLHQKSRITLRLP